MRYELLYTAVAERDVGRVPEAVLDLLEEGLFSLAESPVSLSRPTVSPPFRRGA